jgi:short-subunit dehydrogenase
MSQRILISGATSGIAQAVAARLAARGDRLVLAGRDPSELQRMAQNLAIRHRVEARVQSFDATDFHSCTALFDEAEAALGGDLDGVLLCHGFMMDDVEVRKDASHIERTMVINLTSTIIIAERAATKFEGRERGWLAAISSVAGDRGRQSNYIYGTSKAGLSAYLQGLRNRLHAVGVHVLTIKPGFVHTALTDGVLDPNSPLVATPDRVAGDIVRAIDRRRNVLYTPWFWRWIMLIIECIPEALFKRLKL